MITNYFVNRDELLSEIFKIFPYYKIMWESSSIEFPELLNKLCIEMFIASSQDEFQYELRSQHYYSIKYDLPLLVRFLRKNGYLPTDYITGV